MPIPSFSTNLNTKFFTTNINHVFILRGIRPLPRSHDRGTNRNAVFGGDGFSSFRNCQIDFKKFTASSLERVKIKMKTKFLFTLSSSNRGHSHYLN